MKLVLRRSQKETGKLSKAVVYTLHATAELTDEEKANVSKYKVGNTVLYTNNDTNDTDGFFKAFAKSATSVTVTVSALVNGESFSAKSITEMLYLEESIKEACANFKTILDAMATFDGEEIIEY